MPWSSPLVSSPFWSADVGLLSFSSRVATVGLARLGATGCPGIQMQRLDQSAVASCIQTAVPTDPGQIAISLVSGGGWLAIGETTMRSTDDLATWTVS